MSSNLIELTSRLHSQRLELVSQSWVLIAILAPFDLVIYIFSLISLHSHSLHSNKSNKRVTSSRIRDYQINRSSHLYSSILFNPLLLIFLLLSPSSLIIHPLTHLISISFSMSCIKDTHAYLIFEMVWDSLRRSLRENWEEFEWDVDIDWLIDWLMCVIREKWEKRRK